MSGFARSPDPLKGPGWNPVVTELTWTWHPTPAALWRSVVGGVAGAGAFYRTLSDADRMRFRTAFDAVVDERCEGDAVPLIQTAAIAAESQG